MAGRSFRACSGLSGAPAFCSDVGDEFDGLASYGSDGLVVMIVAQDNEPFAFCGGGDEEVDSAG